jgi:hypothetical protein
MTANAANSAVMPVITFGYSVLVTSGYIPAPGGIAIPFQPARLRAIPEHVPAKR